MKIDKPQVAGYGLHYYANNRLFPNLADRVLLQTLIDMVRRQLATSLENKTIIISRNQLGRTAGLDAKRTIPSCLKKLERLGLVRLHKNGVTINCDEYVTVVQSYESLSASEKESFVNDFLRDGIKVVGNYANGVKLHCCSELLGQSGSSIPINQIDKCKNALPEVQNCTISENQNGKRCKNTPFPSPELQNGVFLHHTDEWCNITPFPDSEDKNGVILHLLLEDMAQTLHICSEFCNIDEMMTAFDGVELHPDLLEAVKFAFQTGAFPKSFIEEAKKRCIFAPSTGVFLHHLAAKTVHFCTTVIIYNNKNNNKGSEAPYIGGENKIEDLNKGFENFGKVAILELNDHSEGINEDTEEIDELPQQNLKRAEKALKARNSYRNKPFIKVERIKEIVECLDEVIKSPVDFFLYQFWWGIFDLYCDHYHPSNKIDEEGEPVNDPQLIDWKEMIGAPLPQDEIYTLAKNVYEDLVGAVEQGRFVYGNNNEWEVKFSFDTFDDFIPHEIFQWSPCTMQDKSVPALKVAIDRFYDIEAKDVFTPSKGDRKAKNAQNKKFIQLILSTEDSQLTPMEVAVKTFYRDFVVTGEDNVIDEFTDGKGLALESGGGLPDYLLKPWCYNLSSVGYNEFTGILSAKYKPCDGIHKKSYIFSAELIVEWNERNGYSNTIAHTAIQD